MFYTHVLRRPAAAEVRQMLHKIKLDNLERARNSQAFQAALDKDEERKKPPPPWWTTQAAKPWPVPERP